MSSIGCETGEVNVFDSLYSDLDEVTKRKLMRVFGLFKITVHFPNVQELIRTVDCGLFAIAFVTNLAYVFEFQQEKLWPHLKVCFEQKYMSTFP